MAAVARKANWFAIGVTVAVVIVLGGLVGAVVWMNSAASGPGTQPTASNIDITTGAIHVGEGEQTLDTYVDFMCPICNNFEQVFGSTIESLVDDGTITLNIHPIAILDRYSQNTEYSTRAANAMYCVAVSDADAALPFQQAMFGNQPSENSTGLTDDEIVAIAAGVGATDVADCITGGTYKQFVGSITQQTPIQPGQTGIATPTVSINGEVIANSTLPSDAAGFEALFRK